MSTVQTYSGPKNEGSFIVKLKAGVDKDAHLRWLNARPSGVEITHGSWNSTFFHGFAGKFDADTIDALRANTDVESIHEDGIMSIESTVTQTDAPWGLSRLSQDERLSNQVPEALTFSYRYDFSAGDGTDIYIIDTGINTEHVDFGGRARWGATFGGYADVDGNGHGTHVAGTAAGTRFGVAKAANLIAVKVLRDDGFGTLSDILSGLNFVANAALDSGRPSIANLSLGGDPSEALDDGVTSASPHVAGLIAYLISVKGALLPAQIRSEIDALSVKDALADIPSGTPNARNDIA